MREKEYSRILFLCQFSYPEYNSSATLPFDTAKYLAEQGYQVDVMCGYPKEYNPNGKVAAKENVCGVGIHRLHYVQLKRSGKLGRLVNYFSYTFSVCLHLLEMRRYDMILCYSNPPILPVVAILAASVFHKKVLFVAYDIYPEVAYASGSISRGSIIDKVMMRINRITYKKAAAVVTLTQEMKDFLLRQRPELKEDRAFVIPNWAHESRCGCESGMYEKFGYQEGQFIVSYFGNMGICQEMNTLMEAAFQLRDNDKVRFLIAGHGSKKGELEEYLQQHDMHNVQMLGFLTGEKFEQALAISSCCVVSLEPGLKGMCAPSKYYSYLQSGHPVIAIVEKDSYLAEEIGRKRIGYHVEIGDVGSLVRRIEELAEDSQRIHEMGKRAYALYETTYDRKYAMEKYREVIRSLDEDR